MKKITLLIAIVTMCFTASNSYGQGLFGFPKTNSFKRIGHTYERQFTWFLKHVFQLKETGGQMDTTMRKIMETKIYEQMLRDFKWWAK